MEGLIGSSNSPLSGIGILVVIGAALLLVFGIQSQEHAGDDKALVAYALIVTAVVFANAAIANNNLQDLKTGQLVDATPWKQQVALVIGVVAGAAIIPPILDLPTGPTASWARRGGPRRNPLPRRRWPDLRSRAASSEEQA
jgi:putative OPT family oligopeptide transporter